MLSAAGRPSLEPVAKAARERLERVAQVLEA